MTKQKTTPVKPLSEQLKIADALDWHRPSFSSEIEAVESNLVLPRKLRYRSDLAFAAGFAALLFFFGYPIVGLIFDLKRLGLISDSTFLLALPLPRLSAPFALLFGIAAWADLKRQPGKSGKLPAILGLTIGFLGTLILLFETYQVVRALIAIG